LTDDSISYPAKEVLLLEEVLASMLLDRQLALDFFTHSINKLDRQKRTLLVNALESHLNEYNNLPLADGNIIGPNFMAKLRPELAKYQGFEVASKDLAHLLKRYKPENLILK